MSEPVAVPKHSPENVNPMRPLFFITCLAVTLGGFALGGCTSSGVVKTSDLSAASCLKHARQALYDADFTENLVVSSEAGTVSGRHAGYDATLYCGGGDHLIRVEVKGLDSDQDDWYRSVIIRKF
jgi:hypothetical protein